MQYCQYTWGALRMHYVQYKKHVHTTQILCRNFLKTTRILLTKNTENILLTKNNAHCQQNHNKTQDRQIIDFDRLYYIYNIKPTKIIHLLKITHHTHFAHIIAQRFYTLKWAQNGNIGQQSNDCWKYYTGFCLICPAVNGIENEIVSYILSHDWLQSQTVHEPHFTHIYIYSNLVRCVWKRFYS